MQQVEARFNKILDEVVAAERHVPCKRLVRVRLGDEREKTLTNSVYAVCFAGVTEEEALEALAGRLVDELIDHATNLVGTPTFFTDEDTGGLGMRCALGSNGTRVSA
jgi:hypothetical protein